MKGLIGKWVKDPCGPATVMAELFLDSFAFCKADATGKPGRYGMIMKLSQETCLKITIVYSRMMG